MVLNIALGIAVFYVFVVMVGWLAADRFIFLPPAASYSADELPVTVISHPDGGSLSLMHLPQASARLTLLVSHGNAEDLGHIAPWLVLLQRSGAAVLAYDYRGYGMSEGPFPNERRVLQDIDLAYRYATETLGIDPATIVPFGRSVGSGPSVWLAANRAVGGLILESAFFSAYRVVSRWLVAPFDRFPNHRRLSGVRAPVLVIHGVKDGIVPVWHGRALYDLAPEPKRALWLEAAGHNDVAQVGGSRYLAEIRAFLAALEPGR